MEGPGWAGMEKKSSDKARGGGAARVAAGVYPEAELVAEKGSAKGSTVLCCGAGAALGPGALSWAKGSAACSGMQLHCDIQRTIPPAPALQTRKSFSASQTAPKAGRYCHVCIGLSGGRKRAGVHTVGCLGAGAVDEGPGNWPNISLGAEMLPAPLLLVPKPDIQSSVAAGLLAALVSSPANASHSSWPPSHTRTARWQHLSRAFSANPWQGPDACFCHIA